MKLWKKLVMNIPLLLLERWLRIVLNFLRKVEKQEELCIKLYGTSWQETSRDDTDAARRFAHYVAGRPSFAEDLNDGGH